MADKLYVKKIADYYVKDEEAREDISNINNTLDTVNNNVNSANETATNAKSTADTAKETADTAKETAENAKSTADNAKSTADTAKSTADTAKETAENAMLNSFFTYSHSAGSLVGSGVNGKFKATVTETITAINVNGIACNVNAGGESSIELVEGAWYTFILDGTTVNFKSGGGLSDSKLALATATPEDVASGKTFYSGDKTIKTGTLIKGARGSVSVTYVGQSVTISLGFIPTYFMLFGSSQSPWMKYYECFNSSGDINAALRTICGTTDNAGQQFSVSYSNTGVTIKKLDASHDQLGTFQYIAY